ncbi:MAG: hypothetical protein ACREEP_08535 [Dongiaceae bacterium]
MEDWVVPGGSLRARLFIAALAVAMIGHGAFAQSLQPATTFSSDQIGLVTIIITVIAVALIILTIGVWRLAATAAKCCTRESDKVIRGYLFPLAPDLFREGGGGTFVLTKLGNFGRTPCILKESYLESVAAEPSGSQAIYQNGRRTTHDLVFDVNAQDERLSVPALPISGAANSYLVGYFRYLDVFGASHTTRYCYLVRPDIAAFERAGSPAWNEFD